MLWVGGIFVHGFTFPNPCAPNPNPNPNPNMAVTSLLGSMMFEKTIKTVATNIGDMHEAVGGWVGGWDFTSSP